MTARNGPRGHASGLGFFSVRIVSQMFRKLRPCTLPETNGLHLKMDGWNTILSFWVSAYFQGRTVSFRECKWPGTNEKSEGKQFKVWMVDGRGRNSTKFFFWWIGSKKWRFGDFPLTFEVVRLSRFARVMFSNLLLSLNCWNPRSVSSRSLTTNKKL